MKLLDVFKTAALFLIAAGLFAMSYVIYDVMGKHARYAPVAYDDETVVLMDTHSGHVWSVNCEITETNSPSNCTLVVENPQAFEKRLAVKNRLH